MLKARHTLRGIEEEYGYLEEFSSRLNLPSDVEEMAWELYWEMRKVDRGGRNYLSADEVVMGIAVYVTCRQKREFRGIDEVAYITDVPKKLIFKAVRFLTGELGINLGPVRPENYVQYLCFRIGASSRVCIYAKKLLRVARKEGLMSGRSPVTMAASSIYVAGWWCREDITQWMVAVEACVSEASVRQCSRMLINELDLELEPEFAESFFEQFSTDSVVVGSGSGGVSS